MVFTKKDIPERNTHEWHWTQTYKCGCTYPQTALGGERPDAEYKRLMNKLCPACIIRRGEDASNSGQVQNNAEV